MCFKNLTLLCLVLWMRSLKSPLPSHEHKGAGMTQWQIHNLWANLQSMSQIRIVSKCHNRIQVYWYMMWWHVRLWPVNDQGQPLHIFLCGLLSSSQSFKQTHQLANVVVNRNEPEMSPRHELRLSVNCMTSFLRWSEQLCSEGTVVENGSIKNSTTSVATLTRNNVLYALQWREERCFQQQKNVQKHKSSANSEPKSERSGTRTSSTAERRQAKACRGRRRSWDSTTEATAFEKASTT